MAANKYLTIIGKQIKKIREARGETQSQLAKEFNKKQPRELRATRVLISRYERSDITIPADKYLKFLAMNPPGNPL